MKALRHTISVLMMVLWLLPSVAVARPTFTDIPSFDSIYSHTPGAVSFPTRVPDPKSTRVQVFIFKKSTVLWTKPIPGLPPLAPGASPVSPQILVKDPQVARLIQKYAKQHGVDPKLVQAMIRQESGFNPIAVSPKGAMGLMQLMPETAASLGIDDPFDVEQNIKGGVRFLKSCLNKFDQNLPLALAAYNAGPGRVVEHQGMPPIKETQTYVKKIVQDYCGQTLDPAQVKMGQPTETKTAENNAVKVIPAQAPASPPLDLTVSDNSSPEKMGAFMFSAKGMLKKDN
jgi:Transglycosylase SLT domain